MTTNKIATHRTAMPGRGYEERHMLAAIADGMLDGRFSSVAGALAELLPDSSDSDRRRIGRKFKDGNCLAARSAQRVAEARAEGARDALSPTLEGMPLVRRRVACRSLLAATVESYQRYGDDMWEAPGSGWLGEHFLLEDLIDGIDDCTRGAIEHVVHSMALAVQRTVRRNWLDGLHATDSEGVELACPVVRVHLTADPAEEVPLPASLEDIGRNSPARVSCLKGPAPDRKQARRASGRMAGVERQADDTPSAWFWPHESDFGMRVAV